MALSTFALCCAACWGFAVAALGETGDVGSPVDGLQCLSSEALRLLLGYAHVAGYSADDLSDLFGFAGVVQLGGCVHERYGGDCRTQGLPACGD